MYYAVFLQTIRIFLDQKMYVLDQDYNDDFYRPRVVTSCNLSFIILWFRCEKKLCKKSDCNSSRDIIFFFVLHPFTNTTCAKNMDMFSSRLTSNSVKMQQMCYRSFIESFWRDNVIETHLLLFLFPCVFYTINFAHFL